MMTEMMPGNVTLADLFRVMSAMQADVAKVATRLEVLDSQNRSAEDIHRDHEQRMRALEAFKWKLVGVAIATGVTSGGLGEFIIWALSRHH